MVVGKVVYMEDGGEGGGGEEMGGKERGGGNILLFSTGITSSGRGSLLFNM